MALNPTIRKLKSRPITFVHEIPTDRLSEFWNGLQKGKVCASKCSKCGNLSFPPVADCSRCLHSGVEWVELQGDGELETFTHIVIRPASFAHHETYTVAVAKMKDDVKVLAWMTDTRLANIKVGARVRLVAKDSEDGPTYAFTLAKD